MIHSASQLLASAFIGLFAYLFIRTVYRLTFHPLAKYPGPFLAKVTTYYDAWYGWNGTRHQEQARCQQKYGNVFRFGPNFLVIQTPEALQELYLHAKQRPVRKADSYLVVHDHGLASTAFTIDKEVHAAQRRVLAHAFSEHALKAQEPLMVQQIDKWIAMLLSGSSSATKGWSTPKNMADYANYLTLDVLGSLCFGKPFGLMDGKLRDIFPDVLFARASQMQSLGNTSTPRIFKWLQENTFLERLILPKLAGDFKKFGQFVMGAMKEREVGVAQRAENGESPRQDFAYYLLEAKDPSTGKGYNARQLSAELRTLVGAGSDTTSTIIAATLYYITRNPEGLKRVQEELRSAFSDINDIVTGPQLSSCHYLKVVIEETLRLAPPVPSVLKRKIMAPMVVGDIALPAGTDVGVAAWGIQHSDMYFPEANKYMPERWLPEVTSKEQLDLMKSVFTPFSQGNRGCIGRNMAYSELTIALGRLFWTYDVRLVAGDNTGRDKDGFYGLVDCFVSRKNGPLCEFRRRDNI